MNTSIKKCMQGYTLAELLLTLTIIAVLIVGGYPSFRSSYRHWVVKTTADELIASLNMARLRAVTHGILQSGVCGYENKDQSLTKCGTRFDYGYLQYDAKKGDADLINPRHLTVIPDSVKICANTWHRVYFDYKGKAWYTNTSNSGTVGGGQRPRQGHDFLVYPADCGATEKAARQITVLPTGRIESIRYVMCPASCDNVS